SQINSSPQPVVLTLASNQRYFPGLYCAIASSLAHMNPNRQVKIFVLDGGLFEQSKSKLVQLTQSYQKRVTIKFITVDESTFQAATLGPGKSHMTYCRLLIPQLVREPRTIYLDSDVLVLRDLSVLYDLNLESNNVMAAVPDSETGTIGDDSGVIAKQLNIKVESQYYNAGIMLMNLDTLRALDFIANSLAFLKDWVGFYRFHDQSAINFLFNDKIQKLPDHWNYPSWKFNQQADNAFNKIIHFTSTLPWLEAGSDPAQVLFEEYAMQLGLILDRSTPSYRKSQRQQVWQNMIAPLRAIAYPLVALGCKLLGKANQAQGYAQAGSYWRNYILTAASRQRLFNQRVEQIRSIKFNVGAIATTV
ncbi:MAG: glycosyltransferase family 8 protein, partial [Moorea sp. SIO2I5]|nr:glycosyltransferase family 8 protein [Moorena sp. SIO2I5]